MRDTKRCATCKQEKPAGDFTRRSLSPDGLSTYCRACSRARNNANHLRFRPARLAAQAEKRATQPDLIREERARWSNAHREEKRARDRRYAEQHREEARQRASDWRKNNPGRMAAHQFRYRRQRADQTLELVNPDDIYTRDKGVCHLCQRLVLRQQATLDHLVPVIQGGAHASWNIRLAHRSCNSRRGAGRTPAQLFLPVLS